MALTRSAHWDTVAYHDFLLNTADSPFKFGVFDCCLFAAEGILAMTGVDVAAEFRGTYTDLPGALKAIKKITGGTTVTDAAAYCAEKAGMEQLAHPLKAQRGDLVIVDNEGTLIAGLVHLNGRDVISVGETGLIRLPITNVQKAWRV